MKTLDFRTGSVARHRRTVPLAEPPPRGAGLRDARAILALRADRLGLLRLIEALVWRENGVRGSFSGGEVVLIILICIAGSGIWTAREHGVRFMNGGLDFWGQQYDYPVSATASATGMKRIVFENPRGNIKVTGGDSKDVTVTGHKQIRAYRPRRRRPHQQQHAGGNRAAGRSPGGAHQSGSRIPNNQRMS